MSPAPMTLASFAAHPAIAGLAPDPSLLDPDRLDRVRAADVVAAGVSLTDLSAFVARAVPGVIGADLVDMKAMTLLACLGAMPQGYSWLPLRDAMCWSMAAKQEQWGLGFALSQFEAYDLAVDGWRFLAAGIEPAEASDLLAGTGGVVPVEALTAMAALRGTALLPSNSASPDAG